ncbi:hypothetical protein ACYJW8_12185 [Frateuria aurantia]
MSTPIYLPAWQRPHWQSSEEEIVVQYFVYGAFGSGRAPSQDYGSPGLPKTVSLSSHRQADLATWDGNPLKGPLGRVLERDDPQAYKLASEAPQVLILHGRFADQKDTGYLRDTFGVLAALLDVGGTAIVDPQLLSVYSAESWRRRYLIKDGAPIRHHLLILRDNDHDEDRHWVHTRGMRLFGRPDLSIRNVPDSALDRAGLLVERLAQLQALGAHLDEGQSVEVDGLADGLVAHLGGSFEHPQFNNRFVEFHWPD